MPAPRSLPAHLLGDAAVLIEVGRRLDTAANGRAIALAAELRKRPGVTEAVPGIASITVHFDPARTSAATVAAAARRLWSVPERAGPSPRLHRIPVDYDGPDLDFVAEACGLTRDAVIALHVKPIYRVFMIGFLPGWAYLGPLPPQLELPRRTEPREKVPAGSVAIARDMTGIYPLDSPGGWHLIGRSDVRLFVPDADPPALLRPGDRVRFFPR